jgi:allantoin racemase
MGFLGVAEEMSKGLGVPVINPGRASLKMAEALVGAGLTHSKVAYMTPPKIVAGEVESSADLMVRKGSRYSEAYIR